MPLTRSSVAWVLVAVVVISLASFSLQERITNHWAVRLAKGVDPHAVAHRCCLEHRKRVGHFEDVFLFEATNASMARLAHHEDHDLLLNKHEHVLWFERQVERKRFKRAVSPIPPVDPAYSNSWHLHGHPGVDINVEGAWRQGYDGSGVTVCVVDDGIWWDHPEFAGAFDAAASRDINFNRDDIRPFRWDLHGTAAAGVVGARANNNLCSVGVAPAARISGIRILAADVSDAQEAEALAFRVDLNHIFSNSWGPNDDGLRLEGPGQLTLEAMRHAIETGRNGLGTLFVWACGNGAESGDSCNYDGYANSRFTISIGSIEYNGNRAYYSEACASLIGVTPSSDRSGHDIRTCGVQGNCYDHFTGTSASSPMVAGILALALQANPQLTWRDAQGVLIESAVMVAEADSDWVLNGAGLHVNHKFGFGLIDAEKTVRKARDWRLLGTVKMDNAVYSTRHSIPDYGPGRELATTVTIDDDIIVEHVEVLITIKHARRGQLHLVLESPMLTQSVIQTNHRDQNSDIHWTYTSIRHWGEGSRGQWKLTVSDQVSGVTGTLESWVLNVYGHARTTNV